MDYSLLLAIETPKKLFTLDQLHQVGAPRLSFTQSRDSVNTDEAEGRKLVDVGELMSLKHCFTNGRRVFHMAIIDYLQEWNL